MLIALPASRGRRDLAPDLPTRALRSQLAIVRTLVDELERLTASPGPQLNGQLVEELAALACRTLEAAAQIASAVEDTAGDSGVYVRADLRPLGPRLKEATPCHPVPLREARE